MKRLQFTIPVLGISLLVLLVMSSFYWDRQEIPTATNEKYQQLCASCHGQQLQGFRMLKTSTQSLSYIEETIINGKPENGMPAFGQVLEEKEVKRIANFIKAFDYESNKIIENSGPKSYEIETIVAGLEIPWGLEFLPNGELLIGEKLGKLSVYNEEEGLIEIDGVPDVRSRGQGGLLDICLHPEYETNGWVYLAYSTDNDGIGNTSIIRARIKEQQLSDMEQIYMGDPVSSKAHHYGCRMVFDEAGYLYFSNGDRGERDRFPQTLNNTNGKIHRLRDDGSVPDDNPFVNVEGAVKSIYSYGHRNPQGLAVHPLTGEIWEHEHGPKGGDEINIIQKGKNYGWPVISYGINYNGTTFTDITEKEGMLQPIHYYVPSIAPCGMTFVTSDKYPGWQNNLLIGSLSFRYLERLELNAENVIYQEKLLEELDARVRTVKMSPDGYIYVTVEGPGRVLRLVPKS